MHYCIDGSPIQPTYQHPTLDDFIEDIAKRVPSDPWQETEELLPLRHGSNANAIVSACLPYCTGETRTDAVYVLECLSNSRYRDSAAYHFGRISKPWDGDIETANRIIYVGMTINLFRRLDEHLNSQGEDGAHFTTVFRPIRVLDVSWWPSFRDALRAEEELAAQLDERFPDDYVYQS